MPGQPMEEILASIKRIIAEDAPLSLGPPTLGGVREKPPVWETPVPEEDVLELEAPDALPFVEPPAFAAPPFHLEPPIEPAVVVHEPHAPPPEEAIAAAHAPEYVRSGPALGTHEPEPTVTATAPAPEPAAPLDPAILAAALDPEPAYESLLSAGAEAASRQALAALNTLTIDSRAAPNTLDGLVREMLRPMVKDWLDKNLPPLVEQLVAKEIKRLGRG